MRQVGLVREVAVIARKRGRASKSADPSRDKHANIHRNNGLGTEPGITDDANPVLRREGLEDGDCEGQRNRLA